MSATILRGDWHDVLPGTYDPARAVVVTDPPYGLAAPHGPANSAPGAKNRGVGQIDDRKGHETGKGYVATTLRYIGQTPTALRGAAARIEEAMG